MKITVAIGQFKTHCYKLLDNLNIANQQMIVTKRNQPYAMITPINQFTKKKSMFGSMRGRAEIMQNLLAPLNIIWSAENE